MISDFPKKLIRIFSYLSVVVLCAFFGGLACSGGTGGGGIGSLGAPSPFGPGGPGPGSGPGAPGAPGAGGSAASPGTTAPPCDPASTPWGCRLYKLATKANLYFGTDYKYPLDSTTRALIKDGKFDLNFRIDADYTMTYTKIHGHPKDVKAAEGGLGLPPRSNFVRFIQMTQNKEGARECRVQDYKMEYTHLDDKTPLAVGEVNFDVKLGDQLEVYYYEVTGANDLLEIALKTFALSKEPEGGLGIPMKKEFDSPAVDELKKFSGHSGESPYPAETYLPKVGEPPFKTLNEKECHALKEDMESPTSDFMFVGVFNFWQKANRAAGLPPEADFLGTPEEK